jgi:hypothetical protein
MNRDGNGIAGRVVRPPGRSGTRWRAIDYIGLLPARGSDGIYLKQSDRPHQHHSTAVRRQSGLRGLADWP